MFSDGLFLIVPSPVISGLIWFLALNVLAYMARSPVHELILSLTRVLHNGCKLSAASLMRAENKLAARNRSVLLASGREASERIIVREFERIDATVKKDLAAFPNLHRNISETINEIDEDYKQSTDVPPDPPGWIKAVDAIAKIRSNGDPTVHKILDQIQVSIKDGQKSALDEYRHSCRERHEYLKNIAPDLRKVTQGLSVAEKSFTSMQERIQIIDRHMEEQEKIAKETDEAVNHLSSSSFTNFFISAFVVAIAAGGAAINFHLIARPMAEMVGGTSYIGTFKIADIAALVIILVELSMGLFLMESMRITRMFPVIGALKDQTRVRMLWITFGLLFCLASVEAGLAFMREIIMQDDLATSALLRGGDESTVVVNEFLWITTVAQMGMGFILPFALVFVAIPLETLVQSLRTVLGVSGVALLRALAYASRLLGNFWRYMGTAMVNFYDLLTFAPLWVERNFVKHRSGFAKDGQMQKIYEDDESELAMKEV